MSNILTAFNNHFVEFLDDVHNVFPDDVDVLTAKNALLTIRKANPKMLVKIWLQFVVLPYQQQIENGDINFFINKDYSQDLTYSENAEKIMESIDRLRNPVRQMTPTDQDKTMKYIQNLSKLALMIPQ
jgi:hypothetical protein